MSVFLALPNWRQSTVTDKIQQNLMIHQFQLLLPGISQTFDNDIQKVHIMQN